MGWLSNNFDANNPKAWGGGGGGQTHPTSADAPLAPFSGGQIYDSPDGSTPLTALPQYGGAGGSLQAASYYAGQDFLATFGRNPSQQELNQLAPTYMGDPNIANQAGGRAAIAQYYQNIANSPANLQKRQLADN